MKMAPIMVALRDLKPKPAVSLVHTGQHYDVAMNHQYFEALGIPKPDVNLEVGSGSHAAQTAEVMRRFEPIMDERRPSAVLVVGDVNSTLACALVAVKKGVPVIHVEAGLRSFDRTMPEEINRILTDQISDLLFTTEHSNQVTRVAKSVPYSLFRFFGDFPPPPNTGGPPTDLSVSRVCRETVLNFVLPPPSPLPPFPPPLPSNLPPPPPSSLRNPPLNSFPLPLSFSPSPPPPLPWLKNLGWGEFLIFLNFCSYPMGFLGMVGLKEGARVVFTLEAESGKDPGAGGAPCHAQGNETEGPTADEGGSNTIAGQDSAKILEIFDEIRNPGADGQVSTRIATAIRRVAGKWLAELTNMKASADKEQITSALIRNAMTIDVEDYFQVSAFASHIPRDSWPSLSCRVERNIDRILAMLDERDVKATFFTLGWIAERYPAMVRLIVDNGHELASHGYHHLRASDQSPDEFLDDITLSKKLLEDLGGQAVIGYRAPSFSISTNNLWALDILLEAGYRYSSSIYPIQHDHYGMPDAPRFKFQPRGPSGLVELPATTVKLFGRNLPASGGGYFRLLPYSLSRWLMKSVNHTDLQPCIFYFHPWEIDPGQPRQKNVGLKTRFRHYVNLSRTEPRIRALLQDFQWGRMDHIFMEED